MSSKKIIPLIFLCVAVLNIEIVVCHVIMRSVSSVSAITYIVGAVYLWVGLCPSSSTKRLPQIQWYKEIRILLPLLCVTILTLFYFSSFPVHYHQDEFITAYTSWTLPATGKLDWFAVYPEVWVSRFPVIFHILQKPWFLVFGPTVTAVRISVLPYALGIVICLYVLSRMVGSRIFAILSCLCFIFFAPHLYLESMGLHFISSSFFFLTSIVTCVIFLNTRDERYLFTCAIGSVLAYLTYTSSYVTLPIIICLFIATVLKRKDATLLRSYLKYFILFMALMLPFLVYAMRVNNFFLERINQVSVFWGTWSNSAKMHENVLSTVFQQTITALKSLILPYVGGIGGYHFGGLALLDPITAIGFCIGIVGLFVNALIKHNIISFSILLAFLLPFIIGFILTTHPPPFHRISLLYPLMAIITAYGFWQIASIFKNKRKYLIIGILLCAFIFLNWIRTTEMIRIDENMYPQNSRAIGEYLVKHFPAHTEISIAAYPSFYLPQELLFRTNNRFIIHTDTTEKILPDYNGNRPLILLTPSPQTITFLKQQFPSGRLYTSLGNVSLGDLPLWLPK